MADPMTFSQALTTGECEVTLTEAGPDVNPAFEGHARLSLRMSPSDDGRYAEVMLDPNSALALREGLTLYLEMLHG